MKYKIKGNNKAIKEIAKNKLENATDEMFEKYMPKPVKEEPVKEFTDKEFVDFLKECANVEKHGGILKIARKYKVEESFVKEYEQKIIEEWASRQVIEDPVEG